MWHLAYLWLASSSLICHSKSQQIHQWNRKHNKQLQKLSCDSAYPCPRAYFSHMDWFSFAIVGFLVDLVEDQTSHRGCVNNQTSPSTCRNKKSSTQKFCIFHKILEKTISPWLAFVFLTLRLAHPVHGIVGAHHHSHLLRVRSLQWQPTKNVNKIWDKLIMKKKCVDVYCVALTMSMSMHFLHPALWLIPALLHQTSTCWTIIKKWKVFKWWTNMPTWLENK